MIRVPALVPFYCPCISIILAHYHLSQDAPMLQILHRSRQVSDRYAPSGSGAPRNHPQPQLRVCRGGAVIQFPALSAVIQ
ncbi:uncharacterized protein EV422DRAFT_542517 [Fimicolochytrium jonesii]|uniref:uncharacterized protein n=1 Tax=Fimicolochytrium jonesii TaxID=1396493 RepID=UPI0022FF3E31|nr:uncharacterized protein EV422DRAFT_542517 [Fimicolochytrium jonesii]KAI8817128.1 hypothetical protein EV422DRAFT_542517 [Fimicolochytrium jonesii]